MSQGHPVPGLLSIFHCMGQQTARHTFSGKRCVVDVICFALFGLFPDGDLFAIAQIPNSRVSRVALGLRPFGHADLSAVGPGLAKMSTFPWVTTPLPTPLSVSMPIVIRITISAQSWIGAVPSAARTPIPVPVPISTLACPPRCRGILVHNPAPIPVPALIPIIRVRARARIHIPFPIVISVTTLNPVPAPACAAQAMCTGLQRSRPTFTAIRFLLPCKRFGWRSHITNGLLHPGVFEHTRPWLQLQTPVVLCYCYKCLALL